MVSNEEKEKIFDRGFYYEKNKKGCAQCLILGLREKYNIPDEVFKSASGLGGGLGLESEGACGAFIGGCMIMGYLFGRSYENIDDIQKARKVSEYVRKYKQKFIEEYGSYNCPDIQKKILGRGGFKLFIPEEFELFESLGAHIDKCPSVVGKAAIWVLEIVEEMKNEFKN